MNEPFCCLPQDEDAFTLAHGFHPVPLKQESTT